MLFSGISQNLSPENILICQPTSKEKPLALSLKIKVLGWDATVGYQSSAGQTSSYLSNLSISVFREGGKQKAGNHLSPVGWACRRGTGKKTFIDFTQLVSKNLLPFGQDSTTEAELREILDQGKRLCFTHFLIYTYDYSSVLNVVDLVQKEFYFTVICQSGNYQSHRNRGFCVHTCSVLSFLPPPRSQSPHLLIPPPRTRASKLC